MKKVYTCQLFLRYKREIFILGAAGIFEDDTIISEDSRRSPKSSEEVQSLPKTSEIEVIEKTLIHKNLFILHMVFVPYMGLS